MDHQGPYGLQSRKYLLWGQYRKKKVIVCFEAISMAWNITYSVYNPVEGTAYEIAYHYLVFMLVYLLGLHLKGKWFKLSKNVLKV